MNQHDNVDLADPGNDPLAQSVDDAMRAVAVGTSFEAAKPDGSTAHVARAGYAALHAELAHQRERTAMNIQLLMALVAMIAALTIIIPRLFT